MNTTTVTLQPAYFSRRSLADWAFALLSLLGMVFAFVRYQHAMDGYEQAILVGTWPAVVWLAWFWRPLRDLMVVVAALSLLAIASYQGDLARAEQVFWLKYFLSSQSAILWMSMVFFISTAFYWAGVLVRGQSDTFELLGSRLTWVGVTLALVLAVPLSLMATRVLSLSALSGRMDRWPAVVRWCVRATLIVLRSVPERTPDKLRVAAIGVLAEHGDMGFRTGNILPPEGLVEFD